MASMLVSSVVDGSLSLDLVKPKTMKLVFVASMLSTALRRKSKDWLAWNQDNVSMWGDMSTC